MNELFRKMLFLPEQASTFGSRVDGLHYFVIITTMVASLLVGLVALAFFVRYRRRKENELTVHVHPTLGIEAMFVLIPFVLFIAWFVIGYRDFVHMTTPPKDTLDVYVMGKQWMWKFNYQDGSSSTKTLRVPAGRPVRLLITSRDVIHSFFVPAFRVKQDAIPGRYTQAWFEATKPGRYPLFCTEFCGLDHSTMDGEVIVMEPAEFDAWYARNQRGRVVQTDASDDAEVGPRASLVQQGERLALTHGCGKCHTVDGERHIGPTWLNMYGNEVVLQDRSRVTVDEAYMTESMMDPVAKVVEGYSPVMPSYRGRLSHAETAALVEYMKSLSGDPIEPTGTPDFEPVTNSPEESLR